jgi:hypothetical protein
MFEQKKAQQHQQNLASSQISSGALGLTATPHREELLTFVRNDSRSQAEIFESLKNRIKRDANGQLDEAEAIQATRNLLGFFETLVHAHKENHKNAVDKQGVDGNIPALTTFQGGEL